MTQNLKRVDMPSKKDQPKMNAENQPKMNAENWRRSPAEARTAQVGAVSAFAVNIEKLKSDRESCDVSRKSFSAQLTEKDAEIDAIKAEEEVVVAKLDKKNAAADSHGSDIPELIKEREELRPDVPKIYEQIKALRDEFNKEGDLWGETERAFRTQEQDKGNGNGKGKGGSKGSGDGRQDAGAASLGEPVIKCPSLLSVLKDTYDHSCY